MESTFIQLSDIVIIISSNINLSLTYGPHSNQFYNQMRLMKIKNLAFAFQAWRFKKHTCIIMGNTTISNQ